MAIGDMWPRVATL